MCARKSQNPVGEEPNCKRCNAVGRPYLKLPRCSHLGILPFSGRMQYDVKFWPNMRVGKIYATEVGIYIYVCIRERLRTYS